MERRRPGQLSLTASDEGLTSLAQQGDLQAFDELVSRHQDRVFALAYRMLADAEDAADVQQEAFVRAWQSLKRFRGQAAFSTWLHKITVNICLSRKRRRGYSEGQLPLEEERISSENSRGVACVERLHTTQAVRAALLTVPGHYRALLVLRDMEERSFEEIAEIVGSTAQSVRTRLCRARKLMREIIRPYIEEEEV